MKNRINHRGETDRVDIRNIHSAAGDDKLPAGGNGIITGIRQIIAEPNQSGNHNVVIRVLGETEPQTCELRRFFQKSDRRLRAYAQIDLWVDELNFAARLEGHIGERVDSVISLAVDPAEHHRLSVVSLLNPDVQPAVPIEGKKKFLQ